MTPSGLDMPDVDGHRLARHEMHGNRVAGERVDAEEIVGPRRLALEGEAPVAHDDGGAGGGVGEEGELTPGDVHHSRADLVEGEGVARAHPRPTTPAPRPMIPTVRGRPGRISRREVKVRP